MALDSATLQSLGLTKIAGNGDSGESFNISDDPMTFADGASIVQLEDGGEEIDFSPFGDKLEPPDHEDNLSERMQESDLNTIANDIMDWVKEDLDSRGDWESMLTQGLGLLGLKIEDRSYPFPGAAGVFDPILLEAVIRWHSTASAELIPAGGPVKTMIVGNPTPETEAQAARVKEFMNFYLLEGAPEWVEQNDSMLFWLPLVGSTFKKTYQDPILNRVVSPFILPADFVVSFSTDDLETCPRATHILNMSVKDMKMRQMSGFFSDIELKEPVYDTETSSPLTDKSLSSQGLSKPTDSDEAPYELYECHIDLDLKGFEHTEDDEDGEPTQTGLPLPYIVTVETGSKKVLSIRRNWKRDDNTYEKIQYFTHFKFVPGLGFYGLGYAHILGNTAKSATSLQRQMIDAATLEMFPGGLSVKGMKGSDNNLMIGPCEFREFDTGGLPIQQAIMPMPYKGPSDVSFQLWQATRENGRGLGGMTEIAVGEGRQDAPVGTTVALMEAANRVQSATLKAAHRAYRREFKLIASLFGQFLPEAPYPWPITGGPNIIMRADFSEQVDVIPVSDPNINSATQRMMRADGIVNMAQQAPQIHDLREAYKQRYIEMGLSEKQIDAILPIPQQAVPSDPLTENQNLLNNKPVKAAEYQDHDAHIASHNILAQLKPDLTTVPAHIAEHQAMKMRVNVQNALGMQLPQPGQQLPPDVENKIAMLVAKAMQQLAQPQGADPTPGQIAMQELKNEALKIQAQLQSIQATTSAKAFSDTLRLKSNREQIQSRERIAALNYRKEKERLDSTNQATHMRTALSEAAKIHNNEQSLDSNEGIAALSFVGDRQKHLEMMRHAARERAFGKRSQF